MHPCMVDRRHVLALRFQRAHLIAAQGASYLYHDEADVSRPWRLDPVPLVLTTADWKPLAEGIAQRATLLDAVLADLYGPQRLLEDSFKRIGELVNTCRARPATAAG